MMIIHLDTNTYYKKDYISPEEESIIENDPNVSSVNDLGNMIKFTYKPFERLKEIANYREPMENFGKLRNYLAHMIVAINVIMNNIKRSELP